ncbi:hypothetical protein [Pollutibacter soli]|uniref:hypothetical protein n=1 Tax=Pollutibacter soli TaxID=3034157 RepID=UPI00301323E9
MSKVPGYTTPWRNCHGSLNLLLPKYRIYFAAGGNVPGFIKTHCYDDVIAGTGRVVFTTPRDADETMLSRNQNSET